MNGHKYLHETIHNKLRILPDIPLFCHPSPRLIFLLPPAFSARVVVLQPSLTVTFSPVEQDTSHLHLPHA